MADLASPINDAGESLHALVKAAAATPYLALGKGSKSVSGLDDSGAGQVVHFDSGTATLANVSGATSSTTLIAANVERIGATIYNDSTAVLYVKFGSTASSTSFTVKMQTDDYFEVPNGYTGIITGIWASATGAARVMELTV